MPIMSKREALAAVALGLQCILVAALALAGWQGPALAALALLVTSVGILLLRVRAAALLRSKRSQAQLRDLKNSVQALSKDLGKHLSEVSRLRAEIRGVRVAQQMTAQTSGATHAHVEQATRTLAEQLARIEESGVHPE